MTNLSSTGDSVCGGSQVTITGTGFGGASKVFFGATSIDGTQFTVNNATSITVLHVPPHDSGLIEIRVMTGGGTSALNPPHDDFSFVPAPPTISQISPDTTSASGTPATATVTGNCFVDQANITGTVAGGVSFGSTKGTNVTVATPANSNWPGPTTLTVDPPADSPSGLQQSVNVTVTSQDGNTSNSVPYYYVSAPSVANVNPNSGSTAGGDAVTITGNDFQGGTGFCDITDIKFGTADAGAPSSCTNTSVTIASPPAGGQTGAVDVVVHTDGGASTTTNADQFTYIAVIVEPKPTLTSLSPTAGPTLGGNKVTLTGTGYQGGGSSCDVTAVNFGGTGVTEPLTGWPTGQGCAAGGTSDTSFVVAAPAETCGTVPVTVVTHGGVSDIGSAPQYTFVSAGVPCVSGVSPAVGPVAGGNTVTITGTGFTGATAVHFGSLTGTIVSGTVTGTSLQAMPPAEPQGTVDVTVTNGFGTSVTNAADKYSFANPPTLTGLTPAKGKGSGGDSVVIAGGGFDAGGSSCAVSEVDFGSAKATLPNPLTCTDSSITVTSPPDAAGGTVNVTVITPGGSSTAVPPTANQFTYVASPKVTAVSPAMGSISGGNTAVLTGTGFNSDKGACDVTAVDFGANAATVQNASNCSDTSLSVTVPPGTALGSVAVTVTTGDGGTSASNASGTYAYGSTVFYFAEGTTRPGFSEDLDILIPAQPSSGGGTATIQYFINGASSQPPAIVRGISGGQVFVEHVNSDVPAGSDVSALVTLGGFSSASVSNGSNFGMVERVMHFGSPSQWHGSTDVGGVGEPSSTWYFAEGSTLNAFNEYLTIQNPSSSVANVTLDWQTDSGGSATKTLTVPATSRTTVFAFAGALANVTGCSPSSTCGVGRGISGVSLYLTSDQPVVAERPMYVNGYNWGSGTITAGHDAFGAFGPASAWYFAEGTTFHTFNEFLTLQNPGTSAATATLTYYTDSAQTLTREVAVPAATRVTVWVYQGDHTTPDVPSCSPAATCGVGPGVGGVAVKVTSTQPIVAERPIYMVNTFPGTSTPVAGATDIVGANALFSSFMFSAFSTVAGDDDFLTLQNPSGGAAHVTIDYLVGGSDFQKMVTVPAGSRLTVWGFDSSQPGGLGRMSGAIGVQIGSDQPILVEKPGYSSNSATYGATDSVGPV